MLIKDYLSETDKLIPILFPVAPFRLVHLLLTTFHFISFQFLIGGVVIVLLLQLFGKKTSVTQYVVNSIKKALALAVIASIISGLLSYLAREFIEAKVLSVRGKIWDFIVLTAILIAGIIYKLCLNSRNVIRLFVIGLMSIGIGVMFCSFTISFYNPEFVKLGIKQLTFVLTNDPLLIFFRLLFILASGVMIVGLWLLWNSTYVGHHHNGLQGIIKLAGIFTGVAAVLVAASGRWLVLNQPQMVCTMVLENGVLAFVSVVWFLSLGAVVGIGGWCVISRPISRSVGYTALLLAIVISISTAIYQNGIHEIALGFLGVNLLPNEVWINFHRLKINGVVGLIGLMVVATARYIKFRSENAKDIV